MNQEKEHSPQVRLALSSVEAYLLRGRVIDPPDDTPPELLSEQAGVFVCFKKHGVLRGCIGTIEPVEDCAAMEIIRNAISAATSDPRFPLVRPDELPYLNCSVDVLAPPEAVRDISELDPKRYGVVVKSGARRGVLLPDLEGVDTAEDQVSIASQKAGIYPGEPCELFRFEVKRYE